MLTNLRFYFFVSVFLFCASSLAVDKKKEAFQEKVLQTQKALWLCHILRQKGSEFRIEGLDFKSLKVPVFMVPKGEDIRPLVRIQVTYNKPEWKLFLGKNLEVKKVEGSDSYMIYAYLNSRISTLDLQAKDAEGNVQKEKVYLFAPEAREYQLVDVMDSLHFTFGIGNLIYEQTSYGVFNGKNLLLGLSYLSPDKGKKWGSSFDSQISFFTFNSEPEDLNPQVYETDLYATYSIKIFESPMWRSRLLAGISATGIFSHGSPFGFSNLYGFGIGVRSEKFVDRDVSYALEAIYVSYDGLSLQQDRALKFLGQYHYNLSSLRKVFLEISYTNHNFTAGFEEVEMEIIGLSSGFNF